MNKSEIVKINPKYLTGYPFTSLLKSYLIVQDHHEILSIAYTPPVGFSKTGIAKVWLLSELGELKEENVSFNFDHSEQERRDDALRSSSFTIKPQVFHRANWKKLTPQDFVTKYPDVLIKSVYTKQLSKVEWQISLIIRFKSLVISFQQDVKEYQIVFIVNRQNDDSVNYTIDGIELPKLTEDIPSNKTTATDLETFSESDSVSSNQQPFTINASYLSGPPTLPGPDLIIPLPNVKIVRLEYIPPADIHSKEAGIRVEYEKGKKYYADQIKIHFSQTIYESVIQQIDGEDEKNFAFLPQERLHPPFELDLGDFRYIGRIPNLIIKDVQYNYSTIDIHSRFVNVEILVEVRTVETIVKRTLEFAFSKSDYINGLHRTVSTESNSVEIDERFKHPLEILNVINDVKGARKALISTAKIINNYPYEKVVDINIVRFIEKSRLVILKIDVTENIASQSVTRSIEKHFILDLSYDEYRLSMLKPEDIQVDYDQLGDYPPKIIPENLFILPSWARFVHLEFMPAAPHDKDVDVKLLLTTGDRTREVIIKLSFPFSQEEHETKIQDELDKDYLLNLKPTNFVVKLDLSGAPVDEITPDDILGLPSGVEVDVKYQKPEVGKKHTTLSLGFKKGNYKVTFQQTIFFEKPTA